MKKNRILASTLIAASFTLSVPALATSYTLGNDSTNIANDSGSTTWSGDTFTISSNLMDPSTWGTTGYKGSWIGWETAGVENSSVNATITGSGFLGIAFKQGSSSHPTTIDLTNINVENFSGQICVVNVWNENTTVKLSGEQWAGVEYIFGGVTRELSNEPSLGAGTWNVSNVTFTRGIESDSANDKDRDILALQGDTTLAGVTGTSKDFYIESVNLAADEYITVTEEGTTLTIAGSGTYGFYGTVGGAFDSTSGSVTVTRASLAMTGTGSQTFGGTNYLYAVTASAGTLILSGTNDISSTVSVTDGGRLNISGTTTFGSTVTVAEGGTLELGGEITLTNTISNSGTVVIDSDVVFVLDNLNGTTDSGSGTTYVIITNTNGGKIEGWSSLDYTNFGLDSARQLTSSENGSVTIDTSQSAQSLTWAGSSSGSVWDSGNSENKVWTNSSSADSFYNGDNVTFTSTGAGTITVSGNVHAGTMTVSSGDYTFSASGSDTLTVDTLTVSGGNITFGVSTTIGTFETAASGSASGNTITLSGGTTVTVGTLTNAYGSDFVLGEGSVLTVTTATFSPGSTARTVSGSGTFSTGSLTLSNYANYTFTGVTFIADTVTMGSNAGSLTFSGASATIGTFNMSNGSTLTFEGGGEYTIGSYTESAQNTKFAIGEYTTVTVGTFSSSWSETFSFGSGSVLNVTEELSLHTNSTETMDLNGGTLNAEKINLYNLEKLSLSNGTLNIGSGGIISSGQSSGWSNCYLIFGDGLTVGVYNGESWSTDATIQFTKSGTGTTFSTNSGESIELSGDLSGTGFSNTGSGELILSGTVGLSDAITNSGTIVVNTGSVVFDLDNLTGTADSNSTTYVVITNDGSITNWGSLDESNFYISGSTIKEVTVTTDGQVTITAETITGLIWDAGSDDRDWNTTATNWKQNGSGDQTFSSNADVWFERSGSGTVTVDGSGVTAGSVTVTGGTYSFEGGSIKVTGTFTINKGAEVDLSKSDSIEGDVVVGGTLKLAGSGGSTGEIIGTITINDGGWVELDTGDATGYSSGVTAITINSGGTLYVGTTSNQTLGSCTLTLVGGTIDGVEGSNLDLYTNSKIVVLAEDGATAENPTVSTVTNVMLTPRNTDNGSGITEVQVAENAKLDVQSGFWSGPNDYSQTLEKTGDGTLEVSGYFALNNGKLIIDAGTVILSGYAGGTSKNYGFASSVTIADGANLEICFKEDASISNVSGAGDFTKSGDTKLTIAGYSVSGTTTVSEGTLVLTGTANFGSAGAVYIEEGATLDLTGVTSSQAGGSSTLYIDGGTVLVDNLAHGWDGRTTNFGSDMWNGMIQISNGGVLDVTVAQTDDTYSGKLRGFAVTSGEGTYRFSGTGTSYISEDATATSRHIHLGNEATLIFDVVQSGATLDVSMVIANGLDTTTESAGTISSGSLVKTGAGTLKLSGTNLYSGGTTIKEGVLVAASSGALGEGEVKIEGGQLSIGSEVTITNSVSVTLSNTYLVSSSLSPTSLGSGTLEPYAAGDSDDGIYAITGTGTLNTTITLFIDDTIAKLLAEAGEEGLGFYIVDTSGVSEDSSFTVSLSEALSGYTYTYDTDTGIVWVAPIPEPSMFGVFAGLGAIGLVATRRRRRAA